MDSINALVDRFLHWAGSLPGRPAAGDTRPARGPRKSLRSRYFLLAGAIGIVCLCSTLGIGVWSYAPVGPRPALATLTPTPFYPVRETLTPFVPDLSGGGEIPTPDGAGLLTPTPPIANVPWAPYAGPIYPALTQIPTPQEVFVTGDDIMNVAVLGSDLRPSGLGGFRTDTIMILILNKTAKKAALVSFPRDLYVYIPAYGMERINMAFPGGFTLNYPGGGFGLFQDTMKYNFGLTIHHYAMMNFWGFKDLIDKLGGIDVYCAYGLHDTRQGYPNGYGVAAGWNHMDGETALWYVRSRYTSSDFDRVRRQQEVLLGISQTLLNKNVLSNLPGFFVTLAQYVESDLTLEAILPFAEMAASVSLSSIQRASIVPKAYATDWITPDGKMVALPNYPAIHDLLAGLLAG
ncbi:MAG: LCP family protein [Anaerolineales bacterium]|nr:LCP family protein [Anaerolineales bacterium]